ncbi:MAG: histidine triad nucleotide-binding protein [Candidatus Omnitrophota bacterium]
MEKECLFCKIAEKKIPAAIVYEDEETVAFDDIKPQAPIHIIVIPKRHIEKISNIDDGDSALTARLIMATSKIAKEKGLTESGYRLVINCGKDAGQEVFHIHVHLLGGRKLRWPPG